MSMKAQLSAALARLPGPASDTYPEGLPFAAVMAHGSMSVEIYAPGSNADGLDRQQPHAQDELYFVQRGRARLLIDAEHFEAEPGDVLFVPAGAKHRFENFSPDFSTWVVFYGPQGGEK
jgi:mannose-6-phosphate isomerase-like protein (cupin superfamily)